MTYPRSVYEAALKKIGLAIRLRREALGFTQESFAHYAQIARTFYGRIERGEQNLALKTLFVLAEHLRCSPAELLGEISLDDKSLGDAQDNDRRA